MNLLPPSLCCVATALAAALAFLPVSSRAADNFSPPPPTPQDPAVNAINEFGLSCLRLTTGNSLISPWSLQQCLGMAYAGAAGQTRVGMGKALDYVGDDARLFEAFRVLSEDLRRAEKGGPKNGLKTANRLFVSEELKLKDEWRTLTREKFSSSAQTLDFSKSAAAEKVINGWVKSETRGKIPEVIPPNGVNALTRLVLVNALSFELPWQEPFKKERTADHPFHVGPKKTITVPLMFREQSLRYAHKKGFQIAALPYAGGAFQFVVILPAAADGLAAVETRLTPQLLAECATLPETKVRLSLPRLKMTPPVVPMKSTLTRLGMGLAFTPKADFRGMSDTPLQISDVYHRTFIEMDEQGTKAAAATAVAMMGGAPRVIPPETVTADHPFIFLIQDVRSGACLFIGRLIDPAAE